MFHQSQLLLYIDSKHEREPSTADKTFQNSKSYSAYKIDSKSNLQETDSKVIRFYDRHTYDHRNGDPLESSEDFAEVPNEFESKKSKFYL